MRKTGSSTYVGVLEVCFSSLTQEWDYPFPQGLIVILTEASTGIFCCAASLSRPLLAPSRCCIVGSSCQLCKLMQQVNIIRVPPPRCRDRVQKLHTLSQYLRWGPGRVNVPYTRNVGLHLARRSRSNKALHHLIIVRSVKSYETRHCIRLVRHIG